VRGEGCKEECNVTGDEVELMSRGNGNGGVRESA
jgi:hypothetical protein